MQTNQNPKTQTTMQNQNAKPIPDWMSESQQKAVAYFNNLPAGTARRIKDIISYHYDQILRDIKTEAPNQEDYYTEILENWCLADYLNTLDDAND